MISRRVLILRSLCVFNVVLPATLVSSDDSKGQIWAVLVASSTGYTNYRHQADVCHAYQILHRHGIPDSNIIVMMHDDIANNTLNPKKGEIYNSPKGSNVYKNVPKDYTGNEVTVQNFINILTGNGTGKVLKSGPKDHVFLNIVDHGATGLVCFPDELMYADKLIQALKTMHKKKMFSELLIYMEACEAGSMFENLLPDNIDVIATTGARGDESAYACYWEDSVAAYLGDEYSVAWMEEIDNADYYNNETKLTVDQQFNDVKERVKSSVPQIFGDIADINMLVNSFIGYRHPSGVQLRSLGRSLAKRPFQNSISSRNVALEVLNKRIKLLGNRNQQSSDAAAQERDNLVKGRNEIDNVFERIISHVSDKDISITNSLKMKSGILSMEIMPCYKDHVEKFSVNCVNIVKNNYVMQHLYKIANACLMGISPQKLLQAFQVICTDEHRKLLAVH